jgi:hypothetical protein
MLSAHRLLDEVIASLRNVIGPAVEDPYAKAQAFMAAVILEFVARQVEERGDVERGRHSALAAAFANLARIPGVEPLIEHDGPPDAAQLSTLIERLYAERARLGESTFAAANKRVRSALRELLDQELKIVELKTVEKREV